jgi:carbamoyltransferase
VGEWATTSAGIGRGNCLDLTREIHFPHSIGLLYSAFTYYTGFKVNSGEYKVMGLAPYGEPRYVDKIFEHLVDLKEDGTYRLDLSYFDYCTGLTMTNDRFHDLFGGPPRQPDELLTQRHMDLAASVQKATEEIVLRLTRSLAAETGSPNLCLAGGVALNCVANGKVLRDGHFKQIWIQPASGDAGGAVGAALAAYYQCNGAPRVVSETAGQDAMSGAYLGPAYASDEIARRLEAAGARLTSLDDAELYRQTVDALEAGKAIGWFQGRMEFGPRALGNRSIIGDPRSPSMQRTMNLRVKYRESFRPFAPAILAEDVADWFEHDGASPYMLVVADVLEKRRRAMTADEHALFGIDKLNVARSDIPAVTHVDYSARVQTVHAETNSRFHKLLQEFKARTGCPVLINTSFNVRGEPIVCTPEDAFRCFMGSDIEVLVAGNCMLRKEDQDPSLRLDYKNAFEAD